MKLEKKELANQLYQYITIIEQDCGDFLLDENKEKLERIKNNPEASIMWNTEPVISLFASEDAIYFPLVSEKLLDKISKLDGFGSNKNHKSCDVDHYVENDCTFKTYIEHAIVKGLTPFEYFEENLLHETMHLCGSGGSTSLEEGLTELKTREVAQKYGLLTSGCGYPKEVKIALRLKEILGEEVLNKVTFLGNRISKVDKYLTEECGDEVANFYFEVRGKMHESSLNYRRKLDTIEDPIQKQIVYDEINYEDVHHMIDEFQQIKQK